MTYNKLKMNDLQYDPAKLYFFQLQSHDPKLEAK